MGKSFSLPSYATAIEVDLDIVLPHGLSDFKGFNNLELLYRCRKIFLVIPVVDSNFSLTIFYVDSCNSSLPPSDCVDYFHIT